MKITKDNLRGVGKDVGIVVGALAASATTTAAFAHYGMDAKEMGDYVAAAVSIGPPVTIACGLVTAGLSQVKQYAHTASRYFPH